MKGGGRVGSDSYVGESFSYGLEEALEGKERGAA